MCGPCKDASKHNEIVCVICFDMCKCLTNTVYYELNLAGTLEHEPQIIVRLNTILQRNHCVDHGKRISDDAT